MQLTSIIGQGRGQTELKTSDTELSTALALAEAAALKYRNKSGADKAAFLRQVADNIESVVDTIAEHGPGETGLPEGRMRGETGRTTGQLRLFAGLVEEGSWVDARIETAQPERQPLPKVDIRSMKRPLGAVAVFCASNFPLAFSVAGGDTASALAAGCPVVVIAHDSHPKLAAIVGEQIQKAAASCGMPEGVFSLLYGGGRTVGQAVVKHAAIKAVGFTGSRGGGTALMRLAAERDEPIPVYAEMSAINPVVFKSGILAEKAESLAEALYGSLTMGVGQFCTNPGLVFVPAKGSEAFLEKYAACVSGGAGATMLNEGICQAYRDGVDALAKEGNVEVIARVDGAADGEGAPAAFLSTVTEFVSNPALSAEVFGPANLILTYSSEDELQEALESLEGQLTATIFGTDSELSDSGELVEILERKAGRVIFNGFPTGVEVCHSMVHGGPFPATSDGRSTSVGTMAIDRYARPVSYQAFLDGALPAELRNNNPLQITRTVNGSLTKDAV